MPKTELAVRPDETPWTPAETKAVQEELTGDLVRLREELDHTAKDLQDILAGGVDGAGNDQADVGSNSLERDGELSLAANQRDWLQQTEKALERLVDDTYGVGVHCTEPRTENHLRAFTRAAL